MNTRTISYSIIIDIIQENTSLLTLDSKLNKLDISNKEKAFIKAICYNFFRYYFSLEKIISQFIKPKTKKNIKIILMLGTLQILIMKQPSYAVINETVNIAKNKKLNWACGLINATLRKILSSKESLEKEISELSKNDLPEWFIGKIKKHYPSLYQNIFIQSNLHAPMFIRVKEKHLNYIQNFLNDNNINYFQQADLKTCLLLDKPIDVVNNDLFKKGYFSIQDKSAQYAGHILKLEDNEKILDACSAPGGKATHLLEINPDINLTAMDFVDKRLSLLKENINRVHKSAKVNILKQDLTKSFNGKFNKILLDAPCSALGVIRRNPDIKILRNPDEIKNIVNIQSNILQNLWDNNLEVNGQLLYITCSILVEENKKQIENFIFKNKNAKVEKIELLKEYKDNMGGYQILPNENSGDGFYYCLLSKSF